MSSILENSTRRNSSLGLKDSAGTAAENVLHQKLDDEIVLLDLQSGVYFGLNEVGSRMWTLLSEESDLDQILEILLGEFDVDQETISEHLVQFCNQLASVNLMNFSDEFRSQIA